MAEAPNRSPEIRKDTVNNRWVIFSRARARRPSDFKSKPNPNTTSNNKSVCPFCIGHEHECAPEIFRVPADSASSDWKIRVIQNLYPALSRDIDPPPTYPSPESDSGDGDVKVSGFGFHDVVIESPVHPVHLSDLSPAEVGDVLLAYKQRILQLRCYDSIKYVQD
ncbi:unnamed protein product [Ilex paraguariensis]|uniref:Galactose-1-phosphate uridylyltransferase n=1 Tax=Ilex paraguariensis TaxID=185542 RepID=A0ABC8SFF9_9AQUA